MVEYLLYDRYYTTHFTKIISFSPHNNLAKQLLSPFIEDNGFFLFFPSFTDNRHVIINTHKESD